MKKFVSYLRVKLAHAHHYPKKWRRTAFLALLLPIIIVGVDITIPPSHVTIAAGPSLKITPASSAYISSNLRVKGFNYAAGETVNVYWNYSGPGTGVLEVSATTDASGAFATKFKMPLAPTGLYTLAGIGQSSGLIATTAFQLLPALSVSPPTSGPGTKLNITGNAFSAREMVTIYWNYTGPGTGTILTTAIGNSTGSFKTKTFVPTGATPGYISIVGVGQTSNATGNFSFVLYPPTLALAPLYGSASTVLTLSAYGFGPGETVKFYWNDDAAPILATTTNPAGYIAPTTITVPADAVPGAYPVTAIGQTTQISISNTFSVVAPGSSLTVSSGPVGESVGISGQGYAPGEAINILWDYHGPGTGTVVATAMAGSSGTFSASFTVPVAANNLFTVAAVGTTSNNINQNSFTVDNSLASSPTTTSPGNNVTVSGTGFQADESVLLYRDNTSDAPIGMATADANGNVSQVITLPSTANPGDHSLIGIGQTSQQSFTAPVTIDTSWGDFGFDNANHRENGYENSVDPSTVANLQRKWMASTTAGLEDSPVYADGILYISTPGGLLDAYDATSGNLIWRFTPTIGFPNYSSPLVDPTTGLVFLAQ
jgi:hypothetical protein